MSGLTVALFGRFQIAYDGKQIEGIESQKTRELLSYLLINHHRTQSREKVAEVLWENQEPSKSKKYLRQAIWRLKTALAFHSQEAANDLAVETDWIRLSPSPEGWQADIFDFEHASELVNNKRAREITADEFNLLRQAVDLYTGDLLEGVYQNWCLYERERFHAAYMGMLSKLVQNCEVAQRYEIGLMYGEKLLRHDRAYERVHRQMMRMYYLAGDRTLALRQYEACVRAMHEELGVDPSEQTVQLYAGIKADEYRRPANQHARPDAQIANSILKKTVERLDHYAETLTLIQSQIQEEILSLESRFQAGQ